MNNNDKNQEKGKNEILIKTLVVISLLIIVVVILLTLINYIKSKDKTYIAQAKLDYIYSDDFNDEIYPEEFPKVLREYEGTLNAKQIGKSLYYVVNEAFGEYKNIVKDMSNDQIKTYYNDNTKLIYMTFGDISETEFLNLMNSLKTLNLDDLKLESYTFDVDQMYKKTMIILVDLKIKYQDCDEIVIKVKIDGSKHKDESSINYYC